MVMEHDEREQFNALIKPLAEIHGKKLSDAATKFYFMALFKFALDVIARSFKVIGETFQRFPRPVEMKLFVEKFGRTAAMPLGLLPVQLSRLKELEDEWTLTCKQICANHPVGHLISHPIARKMLENNIDSPVLAELTRDYSAYKSDLTDKQLFDRQKEIRRQIADVMHV